MGSPTTTTTARRAEPDQRLNTEGASRPGCPLVAFSTDTDGIDPNPVAVHIAPHPDDESLGAPCTLLALRTAGWRVVNVAVSLGRAGQRQRRRAEVTDACRRAGFELLVLDPPADISSDATAADRDDLGDRIGALLARLDPELVVGPSPDDAHHGHRATGVALLDAVRRRPSTTHLWQWSLWADLAAPNLFVPVTDAELAAARHVLTAHAGELVRNDYLDLLEARARVAAIRGAELVFGWGAPAQPERYAELLREVVCDGGVERAPAGRGLDLGDPLGRAQSGS